MRNTKIEEIIKIEDFLQSGDDCRFLMEPMAPIKYANYVTQEMLMFIAKLGMMGEFLSEMEKNTQCQCTSCRSDLKGMKLALYTLIKTHNIIVVKNANGETNDCREANKF